MVLVDRDVNETLYKIYFVANLIKISLVDSNVVFWRKKLKYINFENKHYSLRLNETFSVIFKHCRDKGSATKCQ